MSSVQLVLAAPLTGIRALLPKPLKPLSPFPGYGLVALALYRYDVCDNDPYNEAAVAIVIRDPGSNAGSLATTRRSITQNANYAHVLALPVTTEIARIRGVEGYGLPKWRTDISVDVGKEVRARIAGSDGQADLLFEAPTPALRKFDSGTRLTRSLLINSQGGRWQQSFVKTNVLQAVATCPAESV
jgi:Acetoacetate decarboxylase (ADC)